MVVISRLTDVAPITGYFKEMEGERIVKGINGTDAGQVQPVAGLRSLVSRQQEVGVMWTRRGILLFTVILSITYYGCGKVAPEFTVEKFRQSKATTEAEFTREIGPGKEVEDSYTRSVAEAHQLPAKARFLRWSDPKEPGVHYHVVVLDGHIVERDIWDSRKK